MIKYQLFIAVALLVGVAIGYFVKDEPAAFGEAAKVEEMVAKKPVADRGDEATVSALRQEIVRLKKALAEKDGRNEEAISNAVEKARQPPPRFRNQREWLENLKKNEPERYVQMTNNMAQWRQQRFDRARSRIDFLASVDVSSMSAEAKKTHVALQELIARREEIEEQLQDENLTVDQRRELMEELHRAHRELQGLNEAERDNLLAEMAKALGFQGKDAEDITATIQDVIEATDNGWGGGRRRSPPPGGSRGR